ncbi:ATP-binding protein [Streptacidiphilus neutrinimicus]|uniref:ATP-binding protein n=1 Tax=Streptacidiphilus neutrinimicus TaxID=105420 RepID=UPI000694BBB0|nr:ATP-binding protein [Streptacidiphilus neutrinimicus]
MNDRRAWAAVASFPPHPRNVRHARRITRTALAAWGATDLVDSAEMIVSELVTNAMRYGSGPVDLTLALTDSGLRVSVTDEGTTLPSAREAGEDALGGRGLQIVRLLAESWDVVVRLTGKTVTCVLALDAKSLEDAATEHTAGQPAAASTGASAGVTPAITLSSEAGA